MVRRTEQTLSFLILLAAGGCTLALWFGGVFVGFETQLEDRLFKARTVDPSILIVAVDSESLTKIGQWPWPRRVMGTLLQKLNTAPPKVVGLDVILAEPSRLGAADDAALVSALESLNFPLIMPIEGMGVDVLSNPPHAANVLEPSSAFITSPHVSLGAVNLIIDPDSVVRRFPLEISYMGHSSPTFAHEVLLRGGSALSLPPSQTPRIVYAAATGSIRRIPFARALAEPELLKDKIVFIGATAADLHDEQATPVDRGTKMPGVEIQAEIANMLLKGYALTPLPSSGVVLWIFLLALLPGAFFALAKRQSLFALAGSGMLGIISTGVAVLLFGHGTVVPLIHTNLAWILSAGSLFGHRYALTRREILDVKNAFGKYVSKEVLELILKNPSAIELGGTERMVTVLFSDIRGFTSLSEGSSPAELVSILNRYFSAMTEEVFKHQGVLDKYIGDAVMAFWGAPIDDPLQADHALACALGMMEKLTRFNAELAAEGKAPVDIGIGLYTGPAVVGNIGSEARFDYTVIGDTVNTASRLEGVNKEYKTNIILGESTKKALAAPPPLTHLGTVKVKGKEQGIEIYTV